MDKKKSVLISSLCNKLLAEMTENNDLKKYIYYEALMLRRCTKACHSWCHNAIRHGRWCRNSRFALLSPPSAGFQDYFLPRRHH